MSKNLQTTLLQLIRDYPNFPTSGILFRDLMPVLKRPDVMRDICAAISDHCKHSKPPVDAVAGLEARGFLFGPQIAMNLNIPFVPIRKKGKLPGETVSISYEKEYGKDTVEIQKDALSPGMNVFVFDDLLATGGTMAGAIELIRKAGGKVIETYCIIELKDLKGRDRLKDTPFNSMLQF